MDLLLFSANEKANQATKLMNKQTTFEKKSFWHGNYMAFNEMYSLLSNLKEKI
ncbi:MAG: hypothetical protein PHF25_07045 [Candidatus Margulisbacteria bacterium]|nr:hypothetical protein [Candidatus Margulisiibacteriota bacterium]